MDRHPSQALLVRDHPSADGADGVFIAGTEFPAMIVVRSAMPSDRSALRAMYRRCSAHTRYHRFHGTSADLPALYLTEALTAPEDVHDALVVAVLPPAQTRADSNHCEPPPVIVALASLRTNHHDGGPVGDLGILVEDAWQRRGLGKALLQELKGRAEARGLLRVRADILHQDWRLIAILTATLPAVRRTASRDAVTVEFGVVEPAVTDRAFGSRPDRPTQCGPSDVDADRATPAASPLTPVVHHPLKGHVPTKEDR